MVGGIIVRTEDRKPDRTEVMVAECPHYPKHSLLECYRWGVCCVLTDRILADGTLADLQIGDSFWWQAGRCYWTPAQNRERGGKADIPMTKIGYSY